MLRIKTAEFLLDDINTHSPFSYPRTKREWFSIKKVAETLPLPMSEKGIIILRYEYVTVSLWIIHGSKLYAFQTLFIASIFVTHLHFQGMVGHYQAEKDDCWYGNEGLERCRVEGRLQQQINMVCIKNLPRKLRSYVLCMKAHVWNAKDVNAFMLCFYDVHIKYFWRTTNVLQLKLDIIIFFKYVSIKYGNDLCTNTCNKHFISASFS